MPEVTVFTPTYNRGYIINALYESLLRQDLKNFEWVVIDDGSTDNTEELFSTWTKLDNGFDIKYKKITNGGKHRAINEGVGVAEGRLFFIVDSDDYITDDAISTIIDYENTIDNTSKFAGISFNKGRNVNSLIGSTFKGEFVDATSLERRKYNIFGDKAEVFYTNVLSQYRFPEFEGETFLSEITVWYKIANDGYKLRYFNKIIYICEYLTDGLSKNAGNIAMNNFQGYTYTARQTLSFKLNIIDKAIMVGVYSRTARDMGLSFKEISKNIKVNSSICVMFLVLSKISRFLKIVRGRIQRKSKGLIIGD
jgi:glycosyltransferase involved in cell wall biosynthesis